MERKPMLAPSHNASMAMFSSNLFEGDMADPNIGPGALLLHPAAVANAFGNALRDRRRRWKDGIVPFTVSRNFNADQRAIIAAAIADYHKYTCIKLVNRNKEKDYISIGPGSGCWSYVGYVGGEQTLSLGAECFVKGVVIHELMHALGIQHEQSRTDRDGYVKINFENILPGMEGNFQSYGSDEVDNLGLRYDYDSVMHYPEDGFSKNGKPTIVALEPNRNFGQRTGFSLNDVRKIWTYYECKGKYPEPPPIKYCLDQYSNCDARDCKTSPWLNKPCRLTCKLCRKGT
uniref:Metalloendopeptidase n=1 Tax=Anisakis simplex TaxID=6269 RepID=A0A3G5BC99_ANISI|nr:zinc metalloproteinase nas-13 [Anisakis simplex]